MEGTARSHLPRPQKRLKMHTQKWQICVNPTFRKWRFGTINPRGTRLRNLVRLTQTPTVTPTLIAPHLESEKRFVQQSLRKQEADQQRAKKMAEACKPKKPVRTER